MRYRVETHEIIRVGSTIRATRTIHLYTNDLIGAQKLSRDLGNGTVLDQEKSLIWTSAAGFWTTRHGLLRVTEIDLTKEHAS